MKAIETKKLTKYYGKVVGAKNLDLEVNEGEIFGFIGPNGAGKTTTIRLLLDLIRPSRGSAKIFGRDVNTESANIKKDIGYLPGEVFLADNLHGHDCLMYYKGFKENIDESYVKSLVSRFDLDLKKRIRDYSKGNKQKLAIVLAFMHRPKLLILDEPTSGLDPMNQQEVYKLLAEVKKEGATAFISTHILSETEKVCDRVGIIKDGNLIKIENIEDFKRKNIRQVFIEIDSTMPITALSKYGASKIEKIAGGYSLITQGKIGPLLKEIAKSNVIDVKIKEPSLEEIFFHYYKV